MFGPFLTLSGEGLLLKKVRQIVGAEREFL